VAAAVVLAAVVASFVYLGIDFRALFTGESMRLMARFVAEFFPPDVSSRLPGQGRLGCIADAGRVRAGHTAGRGRRRGAGAAGIGSPRRRRTAALALRAQFPAQRARTGLGRADGAGRGHRALSQARWRWACTPPACWAGCSPKALENTRT
jgi:hypothetical protein